MAACKAPHDATLGLHERVIFTNPALTGIATEKCVETRATALCTPENADAARLSTHHLSPSRRALRAPGGREKDHLEAERALRAIHYL